jgi:dipeptidyl aminopeptidase/acylaminoacyl peptidase
MPFRLLSQRLTRTFRVMLLWSLCLAPMAVTATELLDKLLSAPYVTDLVAAPQAERIAFVVEAAGARNVYTASAPAFTPVRLTDYHEDDGQVISSLALTPNGAEVVFVRGGGPNRAGEYPNPASRAGGVTPQLWAAATDGGEAPRLLCNEALGARISPDGKTVAFTLHGQIHTVALDAKTVATPTALFNARGSNGNPTWSPDGAHLLFVSDRGDHSFIGVYDLAAETIRWVAPDVDRDYAPVWSPDGERIAFLRRPGARRGEVPDITAGWPYALWIADARTGAAYERWRAPTDTAGGFAHYYPSAPLRWPGPDRIVFYSEHEDWVHLYAIAPAGDSPPTDLTPGDGESESSVIARDGRTLVFAGNFDDLDSRRLYLTDMESGNSARVTAGGTIDTDAVTAGAWLAWRSGTAQRPQGVDVARIDGSGRRTIFPTEDATAIPPLPAPQVVVFEASDGLEIHGQLFLPDAPGPQGENRQHAALIFMHGGPIRQMLPGFHYRGYYAKAYAMNQYLASRGYVVLAVNFRSGIGYGREFRQASNQGPRGAAEYKDILAAAAYLQSNDRVDDNRIGLWGGSYGGYLTALGLARDSQLFAAGVDLHGVHDWAFRATDFSPGGYWGLKGEAALAAAVAASPVADLSFWTSPILLIHGDDDRNVLFAQTTDLVQRLRARQVPVETLVFPDEVHGFLRLDSWLRAYRATAEFFDRHLAGAP